MQRRLTFVRAAVVMALVALPLGVGRPASANHALWPGDTIRYYNAATVYRWQVRLATRAWNRADTGIRFVRVTSPGAADLMIRSVNDLGLASGWATVGYNSNAQVRLASPRSRPSHVDKWVMARATAHEFGHVLGLAHEENVCSIMNFGGSLCDPPPLGKWRCRLAEPVDIRRVASRYGGPKAPARKPATCYKWAIPKPARDLTAVLRPANENRAFPEVALEWRNPRSKGLFRVKVNREKGSCPRSHRDRGALLIDEQFRNDFENDVPRGKLDRTVDRFIGSDFGRFCYRVWTGEEAGRYRSKAPRVWVEVPDPDPEPPPTDPPPNDDFVDFAPVFSVPFMSTADLGLATAEEGEPIPSCGGADRTVWFAYAPESDQTVTADTVGTDGAIVTRIAVFAGPPPPTSFDSLVEMGCDAEGDGLQSRVTVDLVGEHVYYFWVAVESVDASVPITFNLTQSS